jgi:hypothetical protein
LISEKPVLTPCSVQIGKLLASKCNEIKDGKPALSL